MHLRRTPFITLMAFFLLMVTIGAVPGEVSSLSAHVGDKPLHMAAYAFISIMAHHSFTGSRQQRALASIILVGFLGLLDESIQSFLPYRNASLLDWCFDIAAAFVVISFFWLRDGVPAGTPQSETPHEKKDQQSRLPCRRAWHALPASHQGQPERDAARGG